MSACARSRARTAHVAASVTARRPAGEHGAGVPAQVGGRVQPDLVRAGQGGRRADRDGRPCAWCWNEAPARRRSAPIRHAAAVHRPSSRSPSDGARNHRTRARRSPRRAAACAAPRLRTNAAPRSPRSTVTPAWRAAAIAASAFSMLCAPMSSHSTVPAALAALENLEAGKIRDAAGGTARPVRLRDGMACEPLARRPAAHRERFLQALITRHSTRCGRRPARFAPDDGTGARWRRRPGRCRRGRTRGCSGPAVRGR